MAAGDSGFPPGQGPRAGLLDGEIMHRLLPAAGHFSRSPSEPGAACY